MAVQRLGTFFELPDDWASAHSAAAYDKTGSSNNMNGSGRKGGLQLDDGEGERRTPPGGRLRLCGVRRREVVRRYGRGCIQVAGHG